MQKIKLVATLFLVKTTEVWEGDDFTLFRWLYLMWDTTLIVKR